MHRGPDFRDGCTAADRVPNLVVRRENLCDRHALDVSRVTASIAAATRGGRHRLDAVLATQARGFGCIVNVAAAGTEFSNQALRDDSRETFGNPGRLQTEVEQTRDRRA